jgi:hypothetical protein
VTSFALNGEVIVGKESVVNDCMLHSGGGNWQYLTNADPSKCFRGAGGFQVDILSPVNNYFYIAISSLTLETIFGVFLGLDINDWPTCVRESGFKDRDGDGEALRLEMAPGRDFTTPGDLVNLNKGIRMKGEFNILGWGATADITVDLPTKVSVSITTDPLDLGSVLQIYKSSTDQTQGPMLSFDAVLGESCFCVFVFLCFCVFVFLALFIDLVTDKVQPLSRFASFHARGETSVE